MQVLRFGSLDFHWCANGRCETNLRTLRLSLSTITRKSYDDVHNSGTAARTTTSSSTRISSQNQFWSQVSLSRFPFDFWDNNAECSIFVVRRWRAIWLFNHEEIIRRSTQVQLLGQLLVVESLLRTNSDRRCLFLDSIFGKPVQSAVSTWDADDEQYGFLEEQVTRLSVWRVWTCTVWGVRYSYVDWHSGTATAKTPDSSLGLNSDIIAGLSLSQRFRYYRLIMVGLGWL